METTFLSSAGKLTHFLPRLDKLLRTGFCWPLTVEIDPTNECTRNCANCAGNRLKNEQAFLSLDFMKEIINQIKPFCKGIIFTGGGEPLRNGHTIEAIKFAKEQGLNVALVTNGDLINKEIAKQLVKYCTYIRFSYYYDDPWDRVSLLVKARNQANSQCTIGTSFLTDLSKVRLIGGAIRQAKEAGVDYMQFRPYHADTTDIGGLLHSYKKKFDSESFKVVITDYKYSNMQERTERKKSYPICLADNFRTVIGADGKVYPDCFTRGDENFSLGDLHKQSFEEIWKSDRRKTIMKNKLDMENCPPMCYHDPLSNKLNIIKRSFENSTHINFI